MDPTTPAPDDSGRPASDQQDAAREEADAAALAGRGSGADDRSAEVDDAAMAADGSADDGWADEGEPPAGEGERSAQDGEPAADLEPATESAPTEPASPPVATSGWRGPEAAGRPPASIEPAASVEQASSLEGDASAESGVTADTSRDDGSAPSDERGDGGTSDWRGPESAGRMPADIEPAPAAESVASTEPASLDESSATDARTSGWRGPEATGWTPDAIGVAPPGQRVPEPSQEWPAADLRPAPRGDVQRSEEADLVDGEQARRGRAPGFSFFNRARSEDLQSEEDAVGGAGYSATEHLRVEERPRRLPGRRAASAVVVRADPAEICPFLVAASGGWRLAVPSREHRCGAVNPPSALSPQKQTRLCLTEGHLRCATFLAAAAARESRVGSAAMPERVSRWALARTTPVVEEVGGVRTTLAGMLADRRRWPAIPAMLLVVALATLGLSSLRGGGAVTALASPSPQPTTAAVPTVSIAPTPSLEPTPEPSATEAPTAPPTAAPTPAPTHATYTVVSGDTLGAIAKQFGTTVQALMDLNGITDPGKLKIGQVLQIP